jgi:hypothetical protein
MSYDPHKNGVSVTLLQGWQTCREAARLKYVCGLRAPQKKVFMEGDIYHQSLSYVIKNGMKTAQTTVMKFVAENEKKLMKSAGTFERESVENVLDMVTVLIPAYFTYWKKDPARKFVMNEDGFEVPMKMSDGKIVPFKGKVDSVWESDKGVVVKESKFKSKIIEGFEDTLGLDLQVTSYILAVKTKFPKSKMACMYDVVRKPALKRGKEESRKQFICRVEEDIAGRPGHYFSRTEVLLTPAEVTFAAERMHYLTQQFYDWWKTASHDVKKKDPGLNGGACESKYGLCDYVPACHRGELYNYSKFSKG